MSAGSDADRDDLPLDDELGLRSWHDRPVVFGIAALLILFGLPCVVWLLGRHAGNEEDPAARESKQIVAEGDKSDVADKDTPSGEPGFIEIGGRKYLSDAYTYVDELVTPDPPAQVRFRDRVEQIQSTWKELHEEATSWYEQQSKLLSGEEGMRLAAK